MTPTRKPHFRTRSPVVCGTCCSGFPAARHFLIPPGRTYTSWNPRAISCRWATSARCPLRQTSVIACSRSHSAQALESLRSGISSDPSICPAANSPGCRTSIHLRSRIYSYLNTSSRALPFRPGPGPEAGQTGPHCTSLPSNVRFTFTLFASFMNNIVGSFMPHDT